jgi:hypothetical protein
MTVREGTIPTALGAVVAGVGATMAAKRKAPKIAAGVVGFGAAHIILGAIDLMQHNRDWE